jgi:hypothetical protein
MSTTPENELELLDRYVGVWSTEATHPALPGVVVHGTVEMEWLEGKRFLIHRARTDHPDFPDSISIIGDMAQDRVDDGGSAASPAPGRARLGMHYFDSRGVFRVYDVRIEPGSWHFARMAPGFSQRFAGSVIDEGATIIGLWQVSRDDAHWDDDLRITYRRSE